MIKQLKNILLLPLALMVGCFISEPKYIQLTDKLDAEIQPSEALQIAEPYLEEHATYHWNKEKELKTHIVFHRKWYYFKRTNYPAKTTRYYLQPAVKIHSKTGEVKIVKK